MWEMEELGRALAYVASDKQSKARHSECKARDQGDPRLSHHVCSSDVYRGMERTHVESGGACETEDKDEVFVLQLVLDKHKCDPVSQHV
jgi:hypothetical protein